MNDTEQLIKEALGRLAERTPHPGPTLNALRRKRKRQRNNIFLIATAGMAAVVTLIFAGVIASDRYTPPNANDAAAALVQDNGKSVAFKYAPHWLPSGFVESLRATNVSPTRVWGPAGATPYSNPSLVIRALGGMPDTHGWESANVRGLEAWVQVRGDAATVVWKAQDVLEVTMSGASDAREVALRVAESVRADAKITHEPPFKLEGRYAELVRGTAPDRWHSSLGRNSISVQVATDRPELPAPNEALTVRGKQGVRNGNTVAVQDGGLWISATSSAWSDELIELVNKVEIAGGPDTGWIGKGL
ncbi:hypothetical protein SAMN04488074_103341 [Lentzea albidocapillata subsp. violacea]|uniref:Uncharacterized protein n=1 Tax=Lentzea albidocapillata subsp. violacea TaxID=128104 RepID=A0A1G8X2H2_9PSEU|nr:hypothetical protein [Lentzea albidocapillata]SDJ84025.1 hypothetical protein SAMN04488074_103341 [Lentzea albidocapillata subsp. violacea]